MEKRGGFNFSNLSNAGQTEKGFFQRKNERQKTKVLKTGSMLGQRKGQVTIFIIIAVLMISGIGLFFLFRTDLVQNFVGVGGKPQTSSSAFLDTCVKGDVRNIVRELSLRGGDLDNPLSTRFMFTEEGVYRNISYLCYTPTNYQSCVNQQPLLIPHLENEIKTNISDTVYDCFDNMLDSFRNQGFDVNSDSGLNDFEVKLSPKRIIIKTDSEVTLTKSDETTTEKNFEISVSSRIYEIVQVVNEMVNQEAEFCNFNYNDFEQIYPEFDISKKNKQEIIGDDEIIEGATIYTVEYIKTNEKFRFAVRNCVMP